MLTFRVLARLVASYTQNLMVLPPQKPVRHHCVLSESFATRALLRALSSRPNGRGPSLHSTVYGQWRDQENLDGGI